MARIGRPLGSGLDDRENIRKVLALMETGMSRRAAAIQVVGEENVRRIEYKMTAMRNAEIKKQAA